VQPKVQSSSPSYHSVAFVLSVLALSIASVPNILSSIDDVATIETCTSPLFPHLLSRSALGWIRLTFAVFIGMVSIFRMTEK